MTMRMQAVAKLPEGQGREAAGALPEWDLSDLYPGPDSEALARDLAQLAADADGKRLHRRRVGRGRGRAPRCRDRDRDRTNPIPATRRPLLSPVLPAISPRPAFASSCPQLSVSRPYGPQPEASKRDRHADLTARGGKKTAQLTLACSRQPARRLLPVGPPTCAKHGYCDRVAGKHLQYFAVATSSVTVLASLEIAGGFPRHLAQSMSLLAAPQFRIIAAPESEQFVDHERSLASFDPYCS